MKIVFAIFVGWAMLLNGLHFGNLSCFYFVHLPKHLAHHGEEKLRSQHKLQINSNCFLTNLKFPFSI